MFLIERVHYCVGLIFTKSGYDEGTLKIYRKYSNFDDLIIFTDFSTELWNDFDKSLVILRIHIYVYLHRKWKNKVLNKTDLKIVNSKE